MNEKARKIIESWQIDIRATQDDLDKMKSDLQEMSEALPLLIELTLKEEKKEREGER